MKYVLFLTALCFSTGLTCTLPTKYKNRDLTHFELHHKDAIFTLKGRLTDELFFYNRVNTLRDDYFDSNEFVRHKLNLDFTFIQDKHAYRAPTSEGFVRLTNYLYWQYNDKYMPCLVDQSDALRTNFNQAQSTLHARNLMPLIFPEQAWFKLNLERICDMLYDRPTSFKIGFFPYTLGRGISLGYHDDLGIESQGWAGEGDFTRYPYMPPAALFTTRIMKNLTTDFYFSKWREVDACIEQTTLPVRHNHLGEINPERGKGKDRNVLAIKADYITHPTALETWHLQPYWLYVNAPEQTIEIEADASAQLHTLGMMINIINDNISVNVECAGQYGYQDIHAIDRNSIKDGNFTHIFLGANDSRVPVPAGNLIKKGTDIGYVKAENELANVINSLNNRNLDMQGQPLVKANGSLLRVNPFSGSSNNGSNDIQTYNSNIFNNKRFRPGYRRNHCGAMALIDINYDFLTYPLRVGAAAGHISGDEYPYNDELGGSNHGFIPLRSRYKGEAVKSFLLFDRLIIPRPMNLSHKNLYAFNNLKNLSDLQYLGVSLSWFPLEDRKTMAVSNDLMFFWKAASINKWDKNGQCPDVLANQPNQLPFDQQQLNFTGWESTEPARRFLGTEFDFKLLYQFIDHCTVFTKLCLFFPGGLYKDLDGQPNIATRSVDMQGNMHYDSLGSQTALGFVCGLDYKF